jgi:hypothetical protein
MLTAEGSGHGEAPEMRSGMGSGSGAAGKGGPVACRSVIGWGGAGSGRGKTEI